MDYEPIFTKYSPETSSEQMFNIFEEIPKIRQLAHQRVFFSLLDLKFNNPELDEILRCGEYSSKQDELEKKLFKAAEGLILAAEAKVKYFAEFQVEKLHRIYVTLQQSDLVKPLQYRRV